jgi:hypothetical protein
MAIEKVLTTVPMGGSARKELVQARRVLTDRLYLLEVERETNPTVAAFVEAKRSKGDERDLAAAVDKYTKMKKLEKSTSNAGGTCASARGGAQNRSGYNMVRMPTAPFPVYLKTPSAHLRWAIKGRRQGRVRASIAWNLGAGAEMPSVRRRVEINILLCWNILWNWI